MALCFVDTSFVSTPRIIRIDTPFGKRPVFFYLSIMVKNIFKLKVLYHLPSLFTRWSSK